ncbi:MAG: outer membrane beta-barrel protein [Micropepsaceae bacterium]
MRSPLLMTAFVMLFSAGAAVADDWNGGYVGLSLGYTDASDAWNEGGSPTDPKLSPEGASFAAYAGYGIDLTGLYLGVEGDITFPDLSDNATCDVLIECSLDINLMTSFRARAGFALGHTLVYGTGGVALGYIQADSDEFGGTSASKTLSGWTLGTGIEYQAAESVRFGIEYRHSDYGDARFDLGTPTGDVTLQTDEVRLRLGIAF